MLKVVAAGAWSVLTTCAVFVLITHFQLLSAGPAEQMPEARIETLDTDVMRVPIMAAEQLAGYVLLKLAVDYDSTAAATVLDKMASIALDEIFRTVYETSSVDYRSARKTDLTALLTKIGDRLNDRLGDGVVKEIRVKEFMYVPPRRSSN